MVQTGIPWLSVVLQRIISSSYNLTPPPRPKLSALIWATVMPSAHVCLLKSLLSCRLFFAFLVTSGSLVPCMALTGTLSLSHLWVLALSTTLDFQLREVRTHVSDSFASLKHCRQPWYSTSYILRLVNVFTWKICSLPPSSSKPVSEILWKEATSSASKK